MLRSTTNAVAHCKRIPSIVGRSEPKSTVRHWVGSSKRRNLGRNFATLIDSQTDSSTDVSRVLRTAKRVVDEKQYAIWDRVLKRMAKYETLPTRRRVGGTYNSLLCIVDSLF